MNTPELTSYRFDRFVVDSRSSCLRREGTPVSLRPKSFDMLLYLVRNAGRLISKDELIDKIWPDVVVTENSLVQCIKDIRQALNDDAHTMLETVAKRGYLFAAPVAEIDADFLRAGDRAAAENSLGPAMPGAPASISARATTARSRWRFASIAAGLAAALLIADGLLWGTGLPVARQPATQASSALT